MAENDHGGAFRDMLVSLSSVLDDEDLQKMKFKCSDIIKKRQSERIKNALDLFSALEERGKLKPDNTTFLSELLRSCCAEKVDGLRIVAQYMNGGFHGTAFDPNSHNPPNVQPQQPQVIYVINNVQSDLPNGRPFQQQRKYCNKLMSIQNIYLPNIFTYI